MRWCSGTAHCRWTCWRRRSTPTSRRGRRAEGAADGSRRILWTRIFASPQDDWINRVLPLRDGTYLALGFVGRDDKDPKSDWRALAVKFTAGGKVLWRREYGGGAGEDAFWAAAETRDGRIVTAGFASRIGSGGGRDVLVVKLDGDGRKQWWRDYGGRQDEGGLYVAAAADGALVIAGNCQAGGQEDVLVLKTDVAGRELWLRRYGDPAKADTPHNLNLLKDGRIQMSATPRATGRAATTCFP